MTDFFLNEVEAALKVVRTGGIILYPTDTVWGLGCDATNAEAMNKIYRLKQRAESKSLIILVADERDILQYVAAPDPSVMEFIEAQTKPTTIIFQNAVNLPGHLLAEDGSVAIRLVKDEFCRHLIKRLQKPLVSTSANISGQPSPIFFDEISKEIKQGVDHIVQWRKDDRKPTQSSRIIRWNSDGRHEVIRP